MDLSGADTTEPFGRGSDCTIWVSSDVANDLEARHPYRSGLQFGCMTVFHEVGHALGLPHSASGLMSEVGSLPWDCIVWARDRTTRATATIKPNPVRFAFQRARERAVRLRTLQLLVRQSLTRRTRRTSS